MKYRISLENKGFRAKNKGLEHAFESLRLHFFYVFKSSETRINTGKIEFRGDPVFASGGPFLGKKWIGENAFKAILSKNG